MSELFWRMRMHLIVMLAGRDSVMLNIKSMNEKIEIDARFVSQDGPRMWMSRCEGTFVWLEAGVHDMEALAEKPGCTISHDIWKRHEARKRFNTESQASQESD